MPYGRGSKRGREGFSIIELAVVLIIVGVLSALSMQISMSKLDEAREIQTRSKLETIEKALLAYRLSNNRLPCPADANLVESNANYGMQEGSPGRCTAFGGGGNVSKVSAAGIPTAVQGVVPYRTLELSEEFMYDAWGRRIAYTVDGRMTENDAFVNYDIYDNGGGGCGGIGIGDAAGGTVTGAAVYALISYGANGHGAYLRDGTRFSSGSSDADELENCDCDSGGVAGTYDALYVQKALNEGGGSFDDNVRFKERWQLQTPEDMATDFYGGPELAVSLPASPYVKFYSKSCDTFEEFSGGTPTLAGTVSAGNAVAISPANTSLGIVSNSYWALAHNGAPYVSVFKRESDGSISDPLTLTGENPVGNGLSAAFSKGGEYLAVGHAGSEFASLYSIGDDDAFTQQNISAGSVDSSLIGHWKFDAGSGTAAIDSSGNGFTGTISGNVAWSSSHPSQFGSGKSLAFPVGVTTDIVTVTNNATVNPTDAITVSVWVKFSVTLVAQPSTPSVWLVSKQNFAGGQGYWLGFRTDAASNPLHFRINGTLTNGQNQWNPGTYFDDFQWHHVAGTYDKSVMRLYVDGVQRASYNYTTAITPAATNIVMGSLLAGSMDDVRIYNRALSAAEVTALAAGGIGVTGTAAAFSASHRYLAVGLSASPYMRLYKDIDGTFTPEELPSSMTGGSALEGAVNSVAFSDDGEFMAVGLEASPYLRLFQTAFSDADGDSFTEISLAARPACAAKAVAFSADTRYLTFACNNGTTSLYVYQQVGLNVWSQVSGARVGDTLGNLNAVAVSPHQGNTLFIGGASSTYLHMRKFSPLEDQDFFSDIDASAGAPGSAVSGVAVRYPQN